MPREGSKAILAVLKRLGDDLPQIFKQLSIIRIENTLVQRGSELRKRTFQGACYEAWNIKI